MLRLSVVGLETTHGYIYPAMLNGYDPERMAANAPTHVSSIFPTAGARSVPGAQVVCCYDPDPRRAQQVAEACLIERVGHDLHDALKDVDGVLITAGDAHLHRSLAEPALEAGLATFVDKPFTRTVADAEALISLAAQRHAPLFCTSAVRYARQTLALQEQIRRSVGTPRAAHVIGTGEYESYAIHALEFLFAAWGGGVAQLRNTGQEGYDTVQLDYADGRRAIWQVCQEMGWLFHLSVFGTSGSAEAVISFSDRYDLFKRTAEQIVAFVEHRESPIPLQETLEIVRLLATARERRGNSEALRLA